MPPSNSDLAQKIDNLAKAAIELLPITQFYCWYPRRTAQDVGLLLGLTDTNKDMPADERASRGQELVQSLEPTIMQVGKPMPLNSALTVFAIFQSDGEVRVYATGTAFTRYSMSKFSPIFGVELMRDEDTFCREVAEEWDALAGIEPDDDDETDDTEEPAAKPALSVVPASSPG